jgi:hypothetical protein
MQSRVDAESKVLALARLWGEAFKNGKWVRIAATTTSTIAQ